MLNGLSIALTPERLDRLRHGTVVVSSQPTAFEITGPGALQCLQGLLTSDVVKAGDDSLTYGALLTPKGMIVVDYWVIRRPQGLTLLAPIGGREASHDLLTRQLPPRLAKAVDRTGDLSVAWLFGDTALGHLRFAGLGSVPEQAGRVADGGAADQPLTIGRPGPAAPFAALLAGSPEAIEAAIAALVRAGATRGDETDRQAARVLAGWPELGAEIDEKTLPQEVRFDEIDGVSYTKGCYTGQETVARLHFRGHANRQLRGLLWRGHAPIENSVVGQPDGKAIGTVRSLLALPDRVFGLGILRREIEPGTEVSAGGRAAEVILLPFGDDQISG